MNKDFDSSDLDALLQTEGAWAEDEQETLRRRAATWKALAKKLWRMRSWDLTDLQLVRAYTRLERDLRATAQGADKWYQDYLTANGERLRLEEECERLRKEYSELELDCLDMRSKLDLMEFAEDRPCEKSICQRRTLHEKVIDGALDFLTRVLK